jgi:CHAT domain-containing protein/tetratricopeptide (TPR) repeat protein
MANTELLQLYNQTVELIKANRLEEALESARQAYQLATQQLPPGSRSIGHTANTLAYTHMLLGETEQAERYFKESLSILIQSGGENSDGHVSILSNLADLMQDSGDYFGQVLYLRQLISVCEQNPARYADRLGSLLDRLGLLHKQYGAYEEAESVLLKSAALAARENEAELATALDSLGGLYMEMGRSSPAEEQFSRALEVRRRLFGERHVRVAQSLNNLASLYQSTGRWKEAESAYEQSISIKRGLGKEAAESLALGLHNLGGYYHSRGEFSKAEDAYRQALDLRRNLSGEKQLQLANTLDALASLHQDRGRIDLALPLFEQALAIAQRLLPPGHPTRLNHQIKLGAALRLNKQLDQAELVLQDGILKAAQSLGNDHHLVISGSDHLIAVFLEQQQTGKAYDLLVANLFRIAKVSGVSSREFSGNLEVLLALVRARAGGDEEEVVAQLAEIADLYSERGQYSAAHAIRLQILSVLTPEQDLYPVMLDAVAKDEMTLGLYAPAEDHLRQAIAWLENRFGKDHGSLAELIQHLATVVEHQGRLDEALEDYQQALRIHANLFPQPTPFRLSVEADLAILHLRRGDIAACKRLLDAVYAQAEKVSGPPKTMFWGLLNTIGTLYTRIGDFAQAESMLTRAAQINASIYEEEERERWIPLNNLGTLYYAMGRHQEARQALEKVCAAWRRLLGEDHPDYSDSSNNLANVCIAQGDYDAADRLLRSALKTRMDKLGLEHPAVAQILHNLASLAMDVPNYEVAESYLLEAVRIRRKALGEEHPQLATSYQNLSYLYAMQDRLEEALQMSKQEERILLAQMGWTFRVTSERQRIAHLSSLLPNLGNLLYLTVRIAVQLPHRLPEMFDLIIKRKGLSMEMLAVQQLLLRGENDPDRRTLVEQLGVIRQKMAGLQLAGATTVGPDGAALAALEAEQETLESALSKDLPGLDLARGLEAANRRSIAACLPPGSALVEFFAVPAENAAFRYLAFILKPSVPDTVEMIDLGDAEQIEVEIAAWLSAITGVQHKPDSSKRSARTTGLNLREAIRNSTRAVGAREVTEYTQGLRQGERLRQRLFDPLAPYVNECSHLYIAPDGMLSLLPFEAMPLNSQCYVLDQYKISYLSTGRDLLKARPDSEHASGPSLVIAAPDYDLGAEKVGNFTEEFPFDRLTNALLEGEKVAEILNARRLFGDDASEAVIKECHSPAVLHLATHGFFLPDPPVEPGQPASGFVEDGAGQRMMNLSQVRNPMLRSGLALSGANAWAQGAELAPGEEDGILTAEDVVGLDLQGTKLVVLSACETGLGRISVGEGVFGLRRAFAIAGAKTLVMSLWKVPDNQTRELMELFYARLREGFACSDALRQAQLVLRGLHPKQPLYWGAFICQGDPGPLALPGTIPLS